MKIGIFGGTFNPIHVGHSIIANYISQNSDLDAIWLMIAPQNPLKDGNTGVSDLDRIKMTEMVTRRLDRVTTSAFEFSLPKPSYTYKTLTELSKKFPDDEFTLIIGGDNWVNFNKWQNADKILEEYNLMVYPRQGYPIDIPEKYISRVKVVNAPIIELSSTYIRDGLKKQQDMCFFIPDDVYKYILENKLYIK